jgi:hypothetical protein
MADTKARQARQLLFGPLDFELFDDFVSWITPSDFTTDADLFDDTFSDFDGNYGIGISQSGIGGLPDRAVECRSLSNFVGTKFDEIGYIFGGCGPDKTT